MLIIRQIQLKAIEPPKKLLLNDWVGKALQSRQSLLNAHVKLSEAKQDPRLLQVNTCISLKMLQKCKR